jgi:hypothetical protein
MYTFLIIRMNATYPAHLILLHLITLIIIQIMKFLIMQASLASYHFFPLRSRYSPQHPVFKNLQYMFFP